MKYLAVILSLFLCTEIVNAQLINNDYYATTEVDVVDGLVLHWPGRHQGMNYAQDVSQYKVQGTITGASWGTGTGRGLYFDGVNDYVRFGDPSDGHLDFGTGSFSCICNIRSSSIKGSFDRVFDKSGGSSLLAGYNIQHVSGFWKAYVSTGSGDANAVKTLTVGTVNHNINISLGFVLNRDNNSFFTYYNGLLSSSGSLTGWNAGSSTSGSGLLYLCSNSSGNFANMNVYDFRVYNRALSSNEANRIYTVIKQ